MKVRFKLNKEPCTQYNVLSGPLVEYDEVKGKYCECLEIEGLGFVDSSLLTETISEENIDAIDLFIELSK